MKSNVLKKVLMMALTASLVVTPVMTAGASNNPSGSNHPSGSSSSSNSGGGGGSSSSSEAVAAPSTSEVVMSDGTVVKSTVKGSYSAQSVPGAAITAPAAVVNAALGVAAGEQAYVTIADSNYGPAAKQSLTAVADAYGAPVGAVLDIFAGTLKDGKFTSVAQASKLVDFRVAAPKDFPLQAGYEYAVIRVQAGGAVAILPDWDNDPTTVTFYTDGFGVFGLVQVPAGSTDAVKIAQYQQANS